MWRAKKNNPWRRVVKVYATVDKLESFNDASAVLIWSKHGQVEYKDFFEKTGSRLS